jgi:hypothetical protein
LCSGEGRFLGVAIFDSGRCWSFQFLFVRAAILGGVVEFLQLGFFAVGLVGRDL